MIVAFAPALTGLFLGEQVKQERQRLRFRGPDVYPVVRVKSPALPENELYSPCKLRSPAVTIQPTIVPSPTSSQRRFEVVTLARESRVTIQRDTRGP